VLYEKSMYQNIAEHFPTMDYRDRINIIADIGAFTISGLVSIDDYAAFVGCVWHNLDLHSIIQMSNDLNSMRTLRIKDIKINKIYTRFHRYFFETMEAKGKLNEDDMSIKGMISARLVSTDAAVRRKFADMFPKLLEIQPELREAVCNAYAMEKNDFHGFLSMYKKLKSDSDRVNILKGMTRLTGEQSFKNVMKLIQDGTVKKQDMMTYFLTFGSWVPNADIALTGAEQILQTIRKNSTDSGRISLFIRNALPIMAVHNEQEAMKIIDNLASPDLAGVVEKAKEKIEINLKFHNMN
jgi:hypothetical protein